MGAVRVLPRRRAVPDDGFHHDEVGPILCGHGGAERSVDGAEIVPIADGLNRPPGGSEAPGDVLGRREGRRAREADAVRVVENDQSAETQMAGQRARLVGDAFHEVAVSGEDERAVIDDLVPGPIEDAG